MRYLMVIMGLLLTNTAFGQSALELAEALKAEACEDAPSDVCTKARALVLELKRIEASTSITRPEMTSAPITEVVSEPVPTSHSVEWERAIHGARELGGRMDSITRLANYQTPMAHVCYLVAPAWMMEDPSVIQISNKRRLPGRLSLGSKHGKEIPVIRTSDVSEETRAGMRQSLIGMPQVLPVREGIDARGRSFLKPGEVCYMLPDHSRSGDVPVVMTELKGSGYGTCAAIDEAGSWMYFCPNIRYGGESKEKPYNTGNGRTEIAYTNLDRFRVLP